MNNRELTERETRAVCQQIWLRPTQVFAETNDGETRFGIRGDIIFAHKSVKPFEMYITGEETAELLTDETIDYALTELETTEMFEEKKKQHESEVKEYEEKLSAWNQLPWYKKYFTDKPKSPAPYWYI